MSEFKFVDLFSGVGGFHYALHDLGGKCVAATEIDDNARQTYELNFNEHSPEIFENNLFFEDITKIKGEDLPDHDIMCGGFPCQAFSIAGYRKGFDDKRGNLFFDILRLAKIKKPKVLFLENVKNLKSHDNGKTFEIIYKSLTDLGYHIHAKVLNTVEFGGVPQNRERVFILGFKEKAHYNNFIFPEKIDFEKSIDDVLLNEQAPNKYYYEGKPLYKKIKGEIIKKKTFYQWRRKYVRENKSGVCPTLTANMGTGGHNVPIILDNFGIRKLTPRETFSLQGFPKEFKLPDLADCHLYKQAGNAVTVRTVQRVGEKILEATSI